jgi:hypothetical protein
VFFCFFLLFSVVFSPFVSGWTLRCVFFEDYIILILRCHSVPVMCTTHCAPRYGLDCTPLLPAINRQNRAGDRRMISAHHVMQYVCAAGSWKHIRAGKVRWTCQIGLACRSTNHQRLNSNREGITGNVQLHHLPCTFFDVPSLVYLPWCTFFGIPSFLCPLPSHPRLSS